jgi:hypothetical protein
MAKTNNGKKRQREKKKTAELEATAKIGDGKI